MSQSVYKEVPKLPKGEAAVYDALLRLQRNGKPDATAAELRETIERLGLYAPGGKPVQRIEKGWVNGRLNELAGRGLVVCLEGSPRQNPETGRQAAPWCIPVQQASLLPSTNASPGIDAALLAGEVGVSA